MGSPKKSRSKSDKSSEVRCANSSAHDTMNNKVGVVEERRKLREAEKVGLPVSEDSTLEFSPYGRVKGFLISKLLLMLVVSHKPDPHTQR
ncbi:hypothetical protein TorRG33x02_222420 [Trema orientale]|uniref:Uncharacterized protein n=1 Tax=Trema orientale TaxID=63057 RepID=A0A2P5E8Q0_TREOI|nr:hypothetical protein TorRG33x02_222420 [Trema orientale]